MIVLEHKDEVVKIIKICLEKFKTTANDETGCVLKLSSLHDKSILSDTPIHNLAEERNVGFLNNKLNLRGQKQFNLRQAYRILS